MGGLLFRRPPLFSPGQASARSEMQLSLGMAPRAIANFARRDSLQQRCNRFRGCLASLCPTA